MRIRKEDMLVYAVTDRSWLGSNTLEQQVEEALRSGVTLLQLREKNITYEEFVAKACVIRKLTKSYGVPLIINDRVDVAIASNADGVHLGQGDEQLAIARGRLGKDKIIGVSAHTVEEAIAAQENDADYIGVGAVFCTSTKSDAKPLARDTLIEICKAVSIPVVAIGGITKDNLLQLSGTGVDGVAVVSAIFAQPDIEYATRELAELAKKMVVQNS